MLLYFIVDPERTLFFIPLLNHPVTWYGGLFALGFFIAYFFVRYELTHFLTHKEKAKEITEELTLYILLGTVLGARLGHVLFYEWPYYSQNPMAILKVWEGGLASHGGLIGVLLALLIFTYKKRKKYPYLHFITLVDLLVIPGALVGGCIRLGNFINQEILGTPTTLPWGVIFKNPAQNITPGIALHPVQIYESLFYFSLFFLLWALWKKRRGKLGEGLLSGIFFLLLFGFRFFIEFLKMPQSVYDSASLTMGQILSLPFILVGAALLIYYSCHAKKR